MQEELNTLSSQEEVNNRVVSMRSKNPGIEKIDGQSESQVEMPSVLDEAMDILDVGMSELSESESYADTIQTIIVKLQTLLKDKNLDNQSSETDNSDIIFTRQSLTNY